MMEFNLIEKHFKAHQTSRKDVLLGIGDDCALLKLPLNHQLAMSTDTLVQGVHYFPDIDPYSLGYKSLAVSLSDLAAMGAKPAWVMLSMTLSEYDKSWMDKFCEGFFNIADQYGVGLIGGDMTSGPQSITTQVTGFLPEDISIKRSGAKPGDKVYITGFLGDAALALAGIQDKISLSNQDLLTLKKALDHPSPRIKAGIALRSIATAAIDISDGLVADLGHVLEQSEVGASIHIEKVPLSKTAQDLIESNQLTFEQVIEYALSGGDDYEICFTSSSNKLSEIDLGCPVTYIGQIESKKDLRLMYEENVFQVDRRGYQHF